MELSRRTLLVVLSCCFSLSLAFECLTQYNSKCESCSQRIQCDKNLKENIETCYSEFNELCVELGSETICSNLETSCKCSGRTGCYDDPYSSHYFIDCSYDIAVYSECPEGEVHDGKCGCTEGVAESNLQNFFPVKGTPRCDWCVSTDASAPCGDYFICDNNALTGSCNPGQCFDVGACACLEVTTTTAQPITNSTCVDKCEYEQPDGCSKFYACADPNKIPYACPSGQCFDGTLCDCMLSTTLHPCVGLECPFTAVPENGCEAYADCYDPSVIQYCEPGQCFDEVLCECDSTTTTTVTITTIPPTTTPIVTLPPSCATCDYYATNDACPKAMSCDDPTAEPITCPTDMCYNGPACQCYHIVREKDTTYESCDRCGLMINPEGTCRSYYSCFDKTERFECDEGSCFDKTTCGCIQI